MLERKEIESIYSMSFYSFDLNDGKMDCVRRKADRILSFKNSLSIFIYNNFEACLEMSQSDMVVQFGQPLSGLTGQDVQNAICDVYTTYSNKFGQIQDKMRCSVQGETKVIKYKRSGKDFKAGDIKIYESTKRTTPFTKVVSFLARYANPATRQWIELALEKDGLEKDKATFYRTVLYYMDKFGEARLLRLAFERREWVYRRYNRVPIEFKSLTFRSTSRTSQDILAHNANRKSVIKNFLNIGGFVIDDVIGEIQEPVFSLDKKDDLDAGDNKKKAAPKQKTKVLSIPTKYAKSFHGDMRDFNKKNPSYLMLIERDRLRIVLTRDGIRDVYVDGEEYVGVDINTKNNLFKMSNGCTIDYDRELFADFVGFLKHMDAKKKNKMSDKSLSDEQKRQVSNHDKKCLERHVARVKSDMLEKTSQMIRSVKESGGNHIVLEDLLLSGKMFSRSDEFDGIKYSQISKILNLSSIKDRAKSMAYKNGVAVSLTPASYTSQQCFKCKAIDKNNRKTQEIFHCTTCHHECNADENSANNLAGRLKEDVLRETLHKKNAIGEWIPAKMSRDKIKGFLSSFCTHRNKDHEQDESIACASSNGGQE